MSFQSYPKYKDSGVEWLGEVPEGWELKRLGYYFAERREKVSDKDYPALSVTKNGIVPQLETAAKTDDGDNRKKVCAGDFVINSRSDRKGSSGLAPDDGSVSLINTVLTPFQDMTGRYAHHLLRSVVFQEEYYRYGRGIVADLWSTNFSEMRNILLAVPNLPEQTSIANFLDRETDKIDALVAEQENLIALLKEKRQAVISHAVTKGLDPTVPMKDSGIEWLGEVPAHWDVKRIKHLCTIISKGTTPTTVGAEFTWNGVRFLKAENITETGVELRSNLVFGMRSVRL
jgi:type I restriction enzyme S subunit